MAIKNSVSNDFCSTFVDNVNIFDCCLSGVGPVTQELLPTLKFVAHTHSHFENNDVYEYRNRSD